ncbi:MAG: DUF4203 domain-containing protein [Mycobacteriaceae bacterium]
MQDLVVGVLALLVGALFCFRGYWAMRFVIPLWGAFAGFNAGAGLVARLHHEGFLVSALGWTVAVAVALLFALFAYLYYAIAVIVAMASIGFALGAAAMAAAGISWNWVIALAGAVAGVLLAVVAIITDLPMALLVILSAIAGAAASVAGLMLLTGTLNTVDFSNQNVTLDLTGNGWWYVLLVVLIAVGAVVQFRSVRLHAGMHDGWADAHHRAAPSR